MLSLIANLITNPWYVFCKKETQSHQTETLLLLHWQVPVAVSSSVPTSTRTQRFSPRGARASQSGCSQAGGVTAPRKPGARHPVHHRGGGRCPTRPPRSSGVQLRGAHWQNHIFLSIKIKNKCNGLKHIEYIRICECLMTPPLPQAQGTSFSGPLGTVRTTSH